MAKRLTEDQIKWILSLDASSAEREVNKLSKENAQLAERNKDVRRSLQQLEAQGKKNSENYRTLSEEYRKNNEQMQTNRAVMKRLDEQMGVANLTMTQLKRRAKDLQSQLNNTSQALHPEEWKLLNDKLTETRQRMAQLKNSAGEIEEQMQKSAQLAGKWSAIYGKALDWGARLLDNAKEIAIEGVRMAESFDGVSRAFHRLDSDGTLLEKLRTATKGTVSDLELMKATVLGNDLQIPLQDIGKYLQFAQLKAQQTGQSVDYLVKSIITGLGRRSVEILDNLGLSTVQIREETEKTGDFMAAVAKIVDEQLAGAAGNYVSASDKAQQATVRFQNAQRELGETLLPLKENWDEVYTSMSVGTMELIGWAVKHRDVLMTLVTAYSAYRATVALSTTVTKENMKVTQASVIIGNAKASLLKNLRGVSLLYAATQAKVTGNTTRAAAAMKLFNTTCKASVIGWIAAGVTAAATAFLLFRKNTDAANEVTTEAIKNVSGEKQQLEALKAVLNDSSKSYGERKAALDELQKIVPEYHASLTKEGKLINNNTEALDGYVEKLLVTAKQQAANAKLQEALNRRIDWVSSQDKGQAIRMKEVEWSINDPTNTGKSEEEIAAAQGVSPTAYRAWKAQKKKLDDDVALYESMMKQYTEELARITAKYTAKRTESTKIPDEPKKEENKENKPQKTTSTTPDPAITELQTKLDAEKALYEQQQLDLMELYASGRDENLQSEAAYNEAMEQLTLMHLQRMMEMSGLDAEQQRQVERELLEFKMKCRQELLDDTERRQKEERALEKENAEKAEQTVRQKFDNMKAYSQQFGEALGNVISGQEDAMTTLGNMMIDVVFKFLEQMIETKLTELAITATTETAKVQAREIGSKGFLGIASGAALAATITGLIAAAKAGLKGIIGKHSSSSSSSTSSGQDAGDIYKRVATGLESGGKIDVVRSQDGKLFPDADYAPDKRGFIDRPTVIVGEGTRGHSREWVASNAAVSNPTVAPVLDIIDRSQQAGTIRTLDLNQAIRARLAGYASGGTIKERTAAQPPLLPFGTTTDAKLIERLAIVLESIERDGIPASVALSEFEKKQQLRDRSRKIGSKK